MTSARHRCFSLLMAKDWFTSRISTSHYDTPGTFDKNHLVCHHRLGPLDSLDLILKVKPVPQITQHMPKQAKKLHTSKVKHAQLSNQNAEKIVINRNEYSCIQFSRSTAKITLYSMSKTRHEQ